MNKQLTVILGSIIGVLIIAISVIFILSVPESKTPNDTALSDSIDRHPIGIKVGEESSDLPMLEVFYDYTCYHCAVAERNLGEYIFENAGKKFNLVLQPVLTVGQSYTQLATEAILIVDENNPELVPAFHKALFDSSLTQMEADNSSVLSNSKQSLKEIKRIASDIGVPDSVISQFPSSSNLEYLKEASDQWVNREDIVRTSDQIGTPEFVLDGIPIVRPSADPEEDLASFQQNF